MPGPHHQDDLEAPQSQLSPPPVWGGVGGVGDSDLGKT